MFLRKAFLFLLKLLPLPLSYRLDFAISDALFARSGIVSAHSLFGKNTFHCDTKDIVQKNFLLHGSNAVYPMLLASKLLAEGDIVLEVGANVGTETLSLSNLVGDSGSVMAIEPDPANLQKIEACVTFNAIKNVELVQRGVDSEAGSLSFVPGSYVNSGVGFFTSTSKEDRSINVLEVSTLDILAENLRPKLIFMDIEGFEIRALQGADRILKQSRPAIIFEFNSALISRAGSKVEDLADIFKQNDYLCFDIGAKLKAIPFPLHESFDTDFLALPKEDVGLISGLKRHQYWCRLLPRLFWTK